MPGHDDQAPVECLTLYRGLSVPAAAVETVISEIRHGGLPDLSRSTFHLKANNLRGNLDRLLLKEDLTTRDTRLDEDARDVICACGDRGGAVFYARRGRPDAVPILVTFAADIRQIYVDGRDALYHVFAQGAKQGDRAQIIALWGGAIVPYLDRAWSSASGADAFACCDLAIQDHDVIRAHCRNTAIIAGRHQTRFASAFLVEVPVMPTGILEVEANPAGQIGPPALSLDDLLGRHIAGRKTV